MRFRDKTIVVTGASSGIGRALALAFAREGGAVVVNYRSSRDAAEAVLAEIAASGGRALAVAADVAKPEAAALLVDAARSFGERIDVWVNNAGADILTGDGAGLLDADKLDRLLEVDLKGTMQCCWAAAPLMRQQGHGVILNMSWDLCLHGFPGRNPQMFAAAKAGVIGFSKSLARDYAPQVRVNVLAPGWIGTEFAQRNMARNYYEARVAEIPLGRFGTVEDVAGAALFLASDEAGYITGQVLNINGGLV